MKSQEMGEQGQDGIGKGQGNPGTAWLELLFCAQIGQAATYSVISCSMEGHENSCWVTNSVPLIPDCTKMKIEPRESQGSATQMEQTIGCVNSQLGQLNCPCFTLSSTSHSMALPHRSEEGCNRAPLIPGQGHVDMEGNQVSYFWNPACKIGGN